MLCTGEKSYDEHKGEKKMKSRNNLVEFARFLFSILVVGYHIQMTFLDDGAHFFANGALAVEFFFLNIGLFSC